MSATEALTANIYRGARPESMTWLHNSGFDRVINLQWGFFEAFHNDLYEAQSKEISDLTTFKRYRTKRLNYHWSDFTAPTVDQLRYVADTINCFEKLNLRTLVHCKFGKDRTGMAIAAYKIIYKGISPCVAIDEMYAHGFHRVPYQFWVNQLRKL